MKKLKHLLWRAGFGASVQDLQDFAGLPISEVLNLLFQRSALPKDLKVISEASLKQFANRKSFNPNEKRQFRKAAKTDVRKLNVAWLEEMAMGAQLRERMSLFWHHHFAVIGKVGVLSEDHLNTIRRHSLGSFKELLHAVSKNADMLRFLNNRQNRKGHPNENFAREVLELFTLGLGHYTEKDIQEAARAFTGWSYDGIEFVLQRKHQDRGTKTFLGEQGKFGGEEILDIILKQKRCAVYLVGKIYRFFVNEKGHSERESLLAKHFYSSNYDIAELMHYIFSQDWFYDEENVGCKIKSPVELLAGMMRPFKIDFHHINMAIRLQTSMSQQLLNPPNVAGWDGGQDWIDPSTMAFRLELPYFLLSKARMQVKPKTELSNEGGELNFPAKKKSLKVSADLSQFIEYFSNIPEEETVAQLSALLIQTKAPSVVFKRRKKATPREQRIKRIALGLMSLPEYQLC